MYRKPSGISGLCIENQWYYRTMYRKPSGISGLSMEPSGNSGLRMKT